MNGIKTLTGLILLAAAPLAAQDVAYRWVDDDGVTHFSDRPPASESAVEELAIPDYRPPSGPSFSYVAMLQRLQSLERELADARLERQERPTPAPVVVQPVHTVERVVTPVFFPHRHGFRFAPPHPDRPAREAPGDRFDRLVEGTRDRYAPPRN